MEILGLQHIGIPTGCFEKTIGFYSDLGFSCAYEATGRSGNRIKFMKLGDLILEIVEKEMAIRNTGSIDHLSLNVADIEDCHRTVIAMGYSCFEADIQHLDFWAHGVRYFTIQGPNNERVEFSQYL